MSYVLGIIPARSGSKGIKNKNIRELAGRPLIFYTIQEAAKSEMLSEVIVSTDSKRIAAICESFGAKVPFLRPKKLALDKTPIIPVLRHAVKFTEKINKRKVDIIVLLQPTAPLRKAKDIDGAIAKLIKSGADSVISVCAVDGFHPARMKKIINQRIYPFSIKEKEGQRRQDLPKAYIRNGAIYALRRDILIKRHSLWGKVSRPYIMPAERSVSIDTKIDFLLAGALLNAKKKN